MVPENERQSKPTVVPACCLKKVSRPRHWKVKPGESQQTPSVEETQLRKSRKIKVATVSRAEYQRGKKCTENSGNLQRVPLEYSGQC